jgi:hypothetical protein
MPLESEAQRRYLWANDPEVARKFEAETPKGAKLPARKKKTEHAMTDTVELKNFSDKQRAKLAKKHEAMPGGGFPIQNGSDLRNAIQAVGRAKDPSAARSWIIRRAKELKLTDQLPTTWELSVRVVDLEDAVIALGSEEFGDVAGHAFHGNQYSDVGSMSDAELQKEREHHGDVIMNGSGAAFRESRDRFNAIKAEQEKRDRASSEPLPDKLTKYIPGGKSALLSATRTDVKKLTDGQLVTFKDALDAKDHSNTWGQRFSGTVQNQVDKRRGWLAEEVDKRGITLPEAKTLGIRPDA